MDYYQVLPVGRIMRLLFGGTFTTLLLLGNPAIIGVCYFDVAGYLVLVVDLYIIAALTIGHRILARVNPWLGA